VTTVAAGSATITASYNSVNQTAALTVTAPPAQATLLSIGLDSTTVPGGGSVTATVTLSGAAPAGGAAVTIQSSDPGVTITIPASVTVPAGATTASFAIGTRETGGEFRVTITASYSGTSRSVLLIVGATPPPLALVSVAINPATVTAGGTAQGTVTLNQAAPASGTAVDLSSNMTSVATVPANVTVAAGSSTATFTVTTTNAASPQTVTISASFNNVTKTATLTVNPILFANFTVSGPSGTDMCKLLSPTTVDCIYDGRASVGAIVSWEFTSVIGSQSVTLTTTNGQLSPTFSGCSFFPTPASVPAGTTSIGLDVHLRVRDAGGSVSGETVNRNVRILPNQQCGFGF
jgi:hypothetical protein